MTAVFIGGRQISMDPVMAEVGKLAPYYQIDEGTARGLFSAAFGFAKMKENKRFRDFHMNDNKD